MTRSYYWDKVRFYKQLVQENDNVYSKSAIPVKSSTLAACTHETATIL